MKNKKDPAKFEVEDFLTDESFASFHFNSNAEHRAYWENWILLHPEKQIVIDEAREMLQMLSATGLGNSEQDEIDRIKRVIDQDQLSVTKSPGQIRFMHWNSATGSYKRKPPLKYLAAAAILVFIVTGYFLFRQFRSSPGQLLERKNYGIAPMVFTLNDGTVITLEPNSSLRYPERFSNKNRDVYLTGEAQFHVAKDANHPFKVHAADMTATVLGTIFNIKKQHGDSLVLIELLEGKLKVEVNNGTGSSLQPIILSPNERVVFNEYNKALYKESWQRTADPLSHPHHLVFQQNSFEEIAKEIKSVFGITVINQSNKKEWRFTGEFNNASAKEIIENICLVKGLNLQATADTILIR